MTSRLPFDYIVYTLGFFVDLKPVGDHLEKSS